MTADADIVIAAVPSAICPGDLPGGSESSFFQQLSDRSSEKAGRGAHKDTIK